MAVPAPFIVPTVPSQGASNFGRWIGPCVAVGPNATLNIDLKYLSKYVRENTKFRENLKITVESRDVNLTCPNPGNIPNIKFFGTVAEPNEYVQIEINSLTGLEPFIVEVMQVHSTIR